MEVEVKFIKISGAKENNVYRAFYSTKYIKGKLSKISKQASPY